jgi:hypothetical protein
MRRANSTAPSVPCFASFSPRSTPEQKLLPSPRSSSTLTDGSASIVSSAAITWSSISSVSALRLSGRLSTSVAT